MLPARPIHTLLPLALTLLLATLEACGGAPVSAGQDGADASDALATPSRDASPGDGSRVVVVVGDAGTSQPADADAAGPADTSDGAAATPGDSGPDEGSDAGPQAAADASTPDASFVDVAVFDAPDVDAAVPVEAAVVEAGPVCTSAQLLCGGACVAIDTNNCGACGAECSGSTPVCGATAGAYACTSGCATTESRCGNGCVDTASDSSNCGACGHACPDGETCQAGQCACPTGETLCGSACTPTATNDANCGTCGHACIGGETCHSGSCECPAGQSFCGSACTTESTDNSNCGACGHACIGGETCQSGTCVCPSGQSFCGSACTTESTDNSNCGACGHACIGGETCQSGTCVCPSGQTFCGSACTNESSDGSNCGTCGHACGGGETCQSGTCACPAGETLCRAVCVNEASDGANCGSCGHGCLGGTCSGGMCQPVLLTTPGGNVEDVATDGTYVYWTGTMNSGSVGKCEIANCAATATYLATSLGGVFPLAVDPSENRVFFGESSAGFAESLWYTTTSGGAPKSWGPTGSVGETTAIWIAPSSVYYWAGPNDVYVSNGAGTYFGSYMTGTCIMGVASDSAHVYATDCTGKLLSCPIGPSCGSSPNVIAAGIAGPNQLYSDGTALWLTAEGTSPSYADGALYKCSATSCSLFAGAQAQAWGAISDATNVYWTDMTSGRVMRSPTGTAAPLQIASVSTPRGLAQTSTALLWASEGASKLEAGGVYLLAK